MESIGSMCDALIGMIGCDAPGKADGDYIGEDGLLYCGECHGRKQTRLALPEAMGGGERIVPVCCTCAEKRFAEKDAAKKLREDLEAVNQLRRNSLIDEMFANCTFENAQLTQYNKRPLSIARQYAERFNEMFAKNRGLLLYGAPGTGKSYAAACIANALMERQVTVMMTSFVKLNATAFSDKYDDEGIIARMNRAKLLIIDDLGAERSSEFSLERVYNVIDSRNRAKKPMILTTNLSLRQMRETDDTQRWRIYDRVFQICFPVEFTGPSFRTNEANSMYREMTELFGV